MFVFGKDIAEKYLSKHEIHSLDWHTRRIQQAKGLFNNLRSMEKIFCGVARITTDEEYDLLKSHINVLIDEATTNGYLSEQGADNEFTHEIARLGKIGALYETEVLHLPKRTTNPRTSYFYANGKKIVQRV